MSEVSAKKGQWLGSFSEGAEQQQGQQQDTLAQHICKITITDKHRCKLDFFLAFVGFNNTYFFLHKHCQLFPERVWLYLLVPQSHVVPTSIECCDNFALSYWTSSFCSYFKVFTMMIPFLNLIFFLWSAKEVHPEIPFHTLTARSLRHLVQL